MKKTLRQMAVLTALTAAALLTAACAGSSSSPESAKSFTAAEAAAGSYDYETSNDIAYPEEAVQEEAVQEAGTVTNSSEGAAPAEVPAGRKLIRNVDMDVETDAFDTLISGINSRISELGGYVEQSSSSGRRASRQNNPLPRSTSITARIPSDKLEQFITTVEDTGNVITKTETTEDVTLRYSDIESRKKSLTIEQERIWELLEKADTLEAVITLEERLSEIRYELESMESRLRLYDNQVDYSTVSLRIEEVTAFTPTSPESAGQRIAGGFMRNLNRMCDFFVDLFISLAAGSPIWVPFACIILLMFYLGRRHAKKGLKKKNSEGEDAAEGKSSRGPLFKKKKD